MGPVFTASSAKVSELRAAIAGYGCFVLTGLFDSGALARIRERADFVSRAWTYMVEHGYTDALKVRDYIQEGRHNAGHLPETHIDAEMTWSDLTAGSRFDEIAAGVFGATTRDY